MQVKLFVSWTISEQHGKMFSVSKWSSLQMVIRGLTLGFTHKTKGLIKMFSFVSYSISTTKKHF